MRNGGDTKPPAVHGKSAPLPARAGSWDATTPREPLPDAEVLEADGGFWVFAYGSLIWNPEGPTAERRPAVLPGYRRSFCLWSVRYRGTPERPGLILGLERDEAAATRGVAYRIAPEHAAEARRLLRERELVNGTYFETMVEARLICERSGDPVEQRRVMTYVVDTAHQQYAGALTPEEKCAVIAASGGSRGPNCEYLFNTVAQLRAEGLSEADLRNLARLEAGVKALLDGASGGA